MPEFSDKIITLYDSLVELGEECSTSISYRILTTPIFQNTDPVIFGGFPWYYRLVTRGSGIYASKKDSFFLSIAPNWNTEKNSFLDEKYIVVRPEINTKSISDFIDFTTLLCKRTKTPLILKQVTRNVCQILQEYGFRQYFDNESWDCFSKYDDQTYPEVVLRTDHYISVNCARGIIRKRVKNNEYHIEEYDLSNKNGREDVKDDVFRVFYNWLKIFVRRYPDAVYKNFVSWNLLVFDAMISDESIVLLSIKDKSGKSVGIFSLIKTTSCQFDMVFSFVSEFIGNFQRVAYDMVICWIQEKYGHCTYLNLGGSELKSLYEFKKSIGSCDEIPTFHLILS